MSPDDCEDISEAAELFFNTIKTMTELTGHKGAAKMAIYGSMLYLAAAVAEKASGATTETVVSCLGENYENLTDLMIQSIESYAELI